LLSNYRSSINSPDVVSVAPAATAVEEAAAEVNEDVAVAPETSPVDSTLLVATSKLDDRAAVLGSPLITAEASTLPPAGRNGSVPPAAEARVAERLANSPVQLLTAQSIII
jgi:hypothetical protein